MKQIFARFLMLLFILVLLISLSHIGLGKALLCLVIGMVTSAIFDWTIKNI